MEYGSRGLNCQVCGADIAAGGIFYVGQVNITSGSDGILPDTGESGDRIIEKALRDITRAKSEEELMEEVHQEIKLILCSRCRLTFRDSILDLIKY